MSEKYGIGERFKTNEGYEVEIVEKIDCTKRRIRFENGYEMIVFMQAIKTGKIKNPYHPSVFGVGYYGVGDYKAFVNRKQTPEYRIWANILSRCYDEKYQQRYPTYKGTIVCEEWLNFQNFTKWYNKNSLKVKGVKFQLDKDLLQNDVKNKIYSPETCVFLPHNVNSFLTNKQSDNTSGYIGVCWDKVMKKWKSNIRLFGEGKKKHLGRFTTPEEAYEVYKFARTIESEKVKSYLRSLDYLSEEVIQLVK